jgi:pyruvate/2-oxoglutarate dehydrogenase complex dihydrolipoamide dehydrogenase (E3) component
MITDGETMKKFDAIVIGAGQAGPSLASRLAASGRTVAVIERKHVGGTCVNTGCKPTKALVASAYAAHVARRAADYGVVVGGPVTIDMPAVMRRSHQITLDSRHGNENWLEEMTNCVLIRGHARFESGNTIRVGEDLLTAPQIFVNVGGRANVPSFPGIAEVPVMTNSDIVMLDRVPNHLVVVGGSYIGLEFAQMYRRFGSQVTVIEKGSRLLAREDEEISQSIREVLEAEGMPSVRTRSASASQSTLMASPLASTAGRERPK